LSSLRGLDWKAICKALAVVGFSEDYGRGKGSHLVLVRFGPLTGNRIVVVPRSKDIPIGTTCAIIKQAGLTIPEFLALLDR